MVRVRFRSEICNWCMHDFEIVQRILQMVQINKSHATISNNVPITRNGFVCNLFLCLLCHINDFIAWTITNSFM